MCSLVSLWEEAELLFSMTMKLENQSYRQTGDPDKFVHKVTDLENMTKALDELLVDFERKEDISEKEVSKIVTSWAKLLTDPCLTIYKLFGDELKPTLRAATKDSCCLKKTKCVKLCPLHGSDSI